MNYTKKAEEIFAELFHESWMTESDWNHFKNKARSIYGVNDLAFDLEEGFTHTQIDERLNEIRKRISA